MKTLDDNQKARIADYLNGKPVMLSDEELDMLAQDDGLAEECLMIARVSDQYDGSVVKKEVKNFKMNVVWFSIAACLMVALMVTVFTESNQPGSQAEVASMEPGDAGNGYIEVAGVQTAALDPGQGFYTAAPNTPFEMFFEDDKVQEDDAVEVFAADNKKTPIFKTKVTSEKSKDRKLKKDKKVKKVKFNDGFAAGLYEYKVYHDGVVVDEAGILIGEN